jgi:hypothetical protein
MDKLHQTQVRDSVLFCVSAQEACVFQTSVRIFSMCTRLWCAFSLFKSLVLSAALCLVKSHVCVCLWAFLFAPVLSPLPFSFVRISSTTARETTSRSSLTIGILPVLAFHAYSNKQSLRYPLTHFLPLKLTHSLASSPFFITHRQRERGWAEENEKLLQRIEELKDDMDAYQQEAIRANKSAAMMSLASRREKELVLCWCAKSDAPC